MTKALDITAERKSTHGDWDEGAGITTDVMARLRQGSRWPDLTPGMQEAVHMIVHKIHRIVTGNPAVQDHWDDIGGYAELVSRRLREPPSGGIVVQNTSVLVGSDPRPSLLGLKQVGKPPLGSRRATPVAKAKGKQPRKRKAAPRAAIPGPKGIGGKA